MATYGKTSPYANTRVSPAGELDILSIRPIPAEDDDVLYLLQSQIQGLLVFPCCVV